MRTFQQMVITAAGTMVVMALLFRFVPDARDIVLGLK